MESKELLSPTTNVGEMLGALQKTLAGEGNLPGEVQVRLRADRDLPIETIKGITLDLHGLEDRLNRQGGQTKVRFNITGEVSEPQD